MSPLPARLPELVATAGPIGRSPVAARTSAAAAAVFAAWLLHWAGGFPLLALATLVVAAAGYRAIASLITRGRHDAGGFVIDAVVGQWLALMPLSAGLSAAGAAPHVFPWPGWVGGFLLFRLLDVWRPGPISRADRLGGARAIVMATALAGILAAAGVILAAAVAHGVLM